MQCFFSDPALLKGLWLVWIIWTNQTALRNEGLRKEIRFSFKFDNFSLTLQSQATNPLVAYLSISTPPLYHGNLANNLSPYTIEMVKGICPNLVENEEPAREGYQLTLKLNLDQIPRNKGLFALINFQCGWVA